jgi:hypothetical protein
VADGYRKSQSSRDQSNPTPNIVENTKQMSSTVVGTLTPHAPEASEIKKSRFLYDVAFEDTIHVGEQY